MINAAEIYGYQSHLNTVVYFHTGVNVIIGESDDGKSAFRRALQWAIENKPLGDDFINWGFKPNDIVRVSLDFSDGEWLMREKARNTTTANQYQLSTMDDPLKALRTGVPDEVLAVTKMTSVNIQPQKEWFLLNEKPGAVAKLFNELADLGVMDKSLQIVNADIREVTGQVKALETKIETAQADLKEKEEWIGPAEEFYELLVTLDEEIGWKADEYTTIDDKLKKLEDIDSQLEAYNLLDTAKKHLEKLKKKRVAVDVKRAEQGVLRRLADRSFQLSKNLEQYRDIDKSKEALKALLSLDSDFNKKLAERNKIASLIESLEQKEESIKNLTDFIDKTVKVIDGKLKQLGICPTCRRPI